MQQLCEKREYFRKRMKIGFAGKKAGGGSLETGGLFLYAPDERRGSWN